MKPSYEHIIHIGTARIAICSSEPPEPHATIAVEDNASVSRAKVIKKVETDKFIAIITPEPDATFEALKRQFSVVEAAGGAVLNANGELLMIHLREHWDLPKGHIEAGESDARAALREVEEETGIVAEIIGDRPLATTWHAYDTYGRWELKRTRWWQMRATGGELAAQRDEGISAAKWCRPSEVAKNLETSYRTIKEVVAALAIETNRCYE